MRLNDEDDFSQLYHLRDLSPLPEVLWVVVVVGAVAGLSMLLQWLGISIWEAAEFAVLVWFVWMAISEVMLR